MKKLDKHIQKSHFVKVYLSDSEGNGLRHFEGVIFSYTSEFIFMCDFSDFNPDGFIVLRKNDISEIRRTDNEKFFDKIIREENVLRNVRILKREAPFRLGKMEQMFSQLKDLQLPVIIECLYKEEESFHLGPVKKCNSDKVIIRYLSSFGVFDKEPMKIAYEDITFFRFGSPYANLFLKYASEEGVLEEMDLEIIPSNNGRQKKAEVIEVEEEEIEEYDEDETDDEPLVMTKVKKTKVTEETVEIKKEKKSKKDKNPKKEKKSKKVKKSKKEKKSDKKKEKSKKEKKGKKNKKKSKKDKKSKKK
jgi:hypothetical protein